MEKYDNNSESELKLPSYSISDEINIIDLLKVLWDGKLTIVITAVLFSLMAILYAINKPDLFKSSAYLVLNKSIYDVSDIKEPSFSPALMASDSIKKSISSIIKVDFNSLRGVNIRFDEKKYGVEVYETSTNADVSFYNVSAIYNNFNNLLKQQELDKVNLALEAQKKINKFKTTSEAGLYLSEIYAQLLYKKAILESSGSKILKGVIEPTKPTSSIEPKRALISCFGALLGIMAGVVLVLVKFTFSKRKFKYFQI